MTEQKVTISLPQVQWEQKVQGNTCRRTYRQGGFLIVQQDFNEKHVIHNYGHGGAEFSFAFGNAYLGSKMITMRQHPTQIHQIAVLGAGISGLMTALELLKKGYKVTIYAKHFPKAGEKEPLQKISTQQGYTYWYPAFYDNCDPVKHELVSKISFRFFKESLQLKRHRSIKMINCYITGPQMENVRQAITEFITKDVKQINVDLGNGKLQQCVCLKTFIINTDLFIEEVLTELRLRKVAFKQINFQSLDDVMKLKQVSVFNCLGIGNLQVFQDKNVQPVLGHYATLTLKQPVKEDFILWHTSSQDEFQDDIVLIVVGKKIQIGSSWERGVSNKTVKQEVIDKMLTKAYHFINERKTNPSRL